MQLDAQAIYELIPHGSNMCLLARVENYSETHIVCLAQSHRDLANPLRGADELGVVAGIEYAAQAIGILGGLAGANDTHKPQLGYLVALRSVEFFVERLDDIDGPLHIEAHRLQSSGNTVICRFEVRGDGRLLLNGRATLVMDLEKQHRTILT